MAGEERTSGRKVPQRPQRSRATNQHPAVPRRPVAAKAGQGTPRQRSGSARPAQRLSTRRAIQQRRQRNIYLAIAGAVLVVLVVGGFLVTKYAGKGGSGTGKTSDNGTFVLPPGLVSVVTGVSVKALVAAAEHKPLAADAPVALPKSNKLLTANGKPEIVYVGAEFCPFCAAERWPLVMALSKFGTFTNLRGTSSSSVDVLPSTPTFSFYGATYKSPYLAFLSDEESTNIQSSSGGWTTLQLPTTLENELISRWDAPPYASDATGPPIPFLYLAGRFLQVSAQYDASSISKTGITTAAAMLTAGNTSLSRNAEAAAAYLVGDMCLLTHDRPASACSAVPAKLKGFTSTSSGSGSSPGTTAKAPSTTSQAPSTSAGLTTTT
ncbi:MAG TPA: DUF929 family protein [Acidimicrobiales bacterium]|nr:DUF929 family protein [Acidimicrobiales bacterium]